MTGRASTSRVRKDGWEPWFTAKAPLRGPVEGRDVVWVWKIWWKWRPRDA